MYQATFDTYITICPHNARYISKSYSSFPSPFAANILYPFHISLNHHSQLTSHATFCLMCSISLFTSQLCCRSVTLICFVCLSVVSSMNYLYVYRITNINTTAFSKRPHSGHVTCQDVILTHKPLRTVGEK